MAALLCDVCGGNLLVDAGGETATCQFCGTQHSMARMREKFEEMKVRVEGNVTVDGVAGVDSLLERAWEFYKNRDYEKASEYYNRILDINPSHSTAREMLNTISGQAAKVERQSSDAKKVERFGVYEAKVTDIDEWGCAVLLTASNQVGYISKLDISDPPPSRIADVISVGDTVQVTVLGMHGDTIQGIVLVGTRKKGTLIVSLLPPEKYAQYYMESATADTMKQALAGKSFSCRMVRDAIYMLCEIETRPSATWSKREIEDRLTKCEIFLAKAVHDNPGYVSGVLQYLVLRSNLLHNGAAKERLVKQRLTIDGWKTVEMQEIMQKVFWEGSECAKMLNDDGFFTSLVRFLDSGYYVYGDHYSNGKYYFEHTDHYEDGGYICFPLRSGNFDFIYGCVTHETGQFLGPEWKDIPFMFPDEETMKIWFSHFKSKKCFAGFKRNFWSGNCPLCKGQCHYDVPGCPLNYKRELPFAELTPL